MDTLPTTLEEQKKKQAEQPNFLQLVNQAIEQSINHPIDTAIAGAMGPLGSAYFQGQRNRPVDNPGLSDFTKAMGEVGGSWIDQWLTPADRAEAQRQTLEAQVGPEQAAIEEQVSPIQTPVPLEQSLGEVGRTMPRSLAQVGMMSNPYTAPVALADSALQAYAPQKDVRSAVIAPLTLAAGMKVIPAAGNLASEATAKAFQPGFQELVQAPAGKYVAQMFGPNAVAENAIAASRIGAETAAGVGLGEASRMTNQIAHGEAPTAPTIQDLAVSAVQNLMYAPLDPVSREFVPGAKTSPNSPEAVRARVAKETLAKVDETRAKLAAVNDTRGQRIADTHKEIIAAVESGADPTELFNQLRSHYIEADAVRKPSVKEASDVLMQMAQSAEGGNLSEMDIAGLVNAVTGRFDEAAKLDPESLSPISVSGAAVSELVKSGLLPKINEEWIKTNFKDAYEQAVGDDRVAKANLVNRIVAHYETKLPEALDRYKAMPRDTGITKKDLDAQLEADKDMQYMQSLLTLMPQMKGKKAPDGTALDESILNRDVELSSATQGQQLQAESAAWGKYDAWKDAMIRLAATYDPVTRTGEFTPSRRMADGTVITAEPTRISLEDLAEKLGPKQYKVDVSPTRKIDRLGQSSALQDAIEFVNERTGTSDPEDMDNPEVAAQQAESGTGIKAGQSRNVGRELDVPGMTIDATREADAAGLTGEEKAAYVKQAVEDMSNASRPMLDIQPDNPATYDLGLWLMNKVDKTDLSVLWNKYGGKEVFGQGATRPGKMQLFKDAIMAKVESDMDGSGQLTAAQTRFYNEWRKYAGGEGETQPAKSWEAMREQVRHALRLYWRQVPDFQSFAARLLDDAPIQIKGKTPQASVTDVAPPLSSVTPTGVVQRFGQTDPRTDTLRLFRGYARELGFSPDDANQFGLTAHNIVSAFDETGAVGRLEAPSGMQGLNLSYNYAKNAIGVDLKGIAQSNADPIAAAVRGLQVLAHEVAHNYTDLPTGDVKSAYRQQRTDAYLRMTALFNDLGPDATNDLLNNVLPEIFVPPQHKLEKTNILDPNQKFDAEAVSRLMEMTVLGAFTRTSPYHGQALRGTDDYHKAFQWLPDDVQAFQRLAFRDIANFAGAVENYYKQAEGFFGRFTEVGKNAAKTRAFLRPLLEYANQFIDTTSKNIEQYEASGKTLLSRITAAGSSDWSDPIVTYSRDKLDRQTLREIADFGKLSFAIPEGEDPFGFKETQGELFPTGKEKPDLRLSHEKRLGATVPPWSKWMGQFYQAMLRYQKAGVPVAEHVSRIVNQLEPSFWRLSQELHKPFTMVDDNGMIKEDPSHPVQVLLKNKHPESRQGLKALETLRLWAVDNQEPVVVKDSTGKTIVTEKAKSVVDSTLGKLSPVIQQGVLEGMYSLTDSYRRAADLRYSSELESVSHNVAKFFMMKDKGMTFDNAFSTAQIAVNTAVDVVRAENEMAAAKQQLDKLTAKTQQQPTLIPDPKLVQLQQQYAGMVQKLKQTRAQYASVSGMLSPEQTAIMENYVFGPSGVGQGLVGMADVLSSRSSWFMSEQRPGRYLVYGKTPEGKQYANGKRTAGAARDLVKELASKGYTGLDIVDKNETDVTRTFDAPDAVLNDFLKIEQSAWRNFLDKAKDQLKPDDMEALEKTGYEPGLASQKYVTNRSLDRYLLPNKLVAGREDLDSFEVFHDYTRRLVGSIARKSVRQQLELVLRDPRAKLNGDFQTTVREAARAMMEPVGEQFTKSRAAITAMFLGFPNLVSPLIEATQSQTTVFPALVSEGGSYVKGVKYTTNAPINIYKYHDAPSTLEGKRLLSSAREKETVAPKQMTKEESMAYYYLRSKQEGRFSHGVAQQEMLAKDLAELNQYSLGMGLGKGDKTLGELAGDSLYWLSRKSMAPYSLASQTNNKIAFMAGLEMLYDKGLRGNDLYEQAHVFKDRATFGGGKSNELGFVSKVSNPRTRSWFSLITVLQRYPFASLTQYKDLLADIRGATNLTPRERLNAGAAFTHAMAAQLVLGGAMALPGAAIANAIFQKLFKWDMKQSMRQLWFDLSKRLGADDPQAVMLANIAQNGVGSQFLGMDLSSRFAINSFMGFDSFEGWNANSMFGAAGSTVERLIGAGKFVAQKEGVKAAQQFLPPSWTPLIDMANQRSQYGQVGMRDLNGGLIRQMTPGEQIKYGLGVRPYWYRQYRDLQEYKLNAEAGFNQTKSSRVDSAASALNQGNSQPAFSWVREYMSQTPSANPKDALRSVVDRALVQSNARDLLSSGVTGTGPELQSAAATFGDAVQRQSETQLLIQREKLNALTGYAAGEPMTSKDITRAQMVDALVKSKGLTRPDALRLVEKMGF